VSLHRTVDVVEDVTVDRVPDAVHRPDRLRH